MKLYKTRTGIIAEVSNNFFLLKEQNWDRFVNDDNLFYKIKDSIQSLKSDPALKDVADLQIEAPMQSQEIWACGVTYLRSKEGRQQESVSAAGADFYSRVYEADRPEIFFKSSAYRTRGHGQYVHIRKDSTWDVPEPELTLMVTSSGKIVGYTIGNDMSSRSIEGENPLYLPQAKTYDGSASVGPCIYVPENPLPADTVIDMQITREEQVVFRDKVTLNQIKRKFEDLVSYLYRENTFPDGCLLMTGTGIVPPSDFSLISNDRIEIKIEPIGTLINKVR